MKIKEGYIVRPVAGSYVVVSTGEKTVDFNGIMTLNETGNFLWEKLLTDTTKEQLVEAMLKEYDVDTKTATEDIERFLKKLEEAGLAE